MPFRFIIGVAALACATICAIGSSFVTFEMVDRVNERLPENRQFSPMWWNWSKYRRLWRAYKELYPNGPLLKKFWALAAVMIVCLVFLAIGIIAR